MGITFFGHDGHDHTVTATIPWWQDQLTVSIALILGFVLILGILHYVAKAKLDVKITVAMAYLLVVGVLCYVVAPVLSIISLTIGMALALTTTMLQLAHKNSPK